MAARRSSENLPRPTLSPLWAIMAFSFANSVGSGIVTSGIYFITKHGYGFSRSDNYSLGLVLGATYIIGAFGAGPAMARLRRSGIAARKVLLAIMLLMAALCAMPRLVLAFSHTTPDADGSVTPSATWPMWLIVCLYSPLTGILWPIVESYVSGGRSGENLRATMGRWNVCWSSALILAFWAIGPLLQGTGHQATLRAANGIALLGIIHVGAALLLGRFSPEPASHVHHAHEPHPPVYDRLLVTFRLLLPLCYLVLSALTPFLPDAFKRLGIESHWQMVVTSVYLISRVITFAAYERWHGWHGRWSMATIGMACLLGGFAASVLASRIDTGNLGLSLQTIGLAVLGFGMATIYTGALYYALVVGQSEVDAGGAHESLIGVGYTVGPLCGLIPSLAVSTGSLPEVGFEPTVLSCVGVISLVVTGLVVRRIYIQKAVTS